MAWLCVLKLKRLISTVKRKEVHGKANAFKLLMVRTFNYMNPPFPLSYDSFIFNNYLLLDG